MHAKKFCGAILCLVSFANITQDTPINIPNLSASIDIDEQLEEAEWEKAKRISLQYVTQPYENTKPPVETEVKLFEDGQILYVAFTAKDPKPEQIRAFFRDHDNVDDDLVGIKLDTFNDGRLAYQFFVGYSSGARQDGDIDRLRDEEQSVFMKFSYAWLN